MPGVSLTLDMHRGPRTLVLPLVTLLLGCICIGCVATPGLRAPHQVGEGNPPILFDSTDYDWRDYSPGAYVAIMKAWYREMWREANTGSFAREQDDQHMT